MSIGPTNILLLLIHMTNLEPNILFCQRAGRIINNVSEALWLVVSALVCQGLSMGKYYLQTLLVLLLLLVNYTKSEVYLVCLLEVRFHSHHLRECFFSMLERAITVV